MNGVKAYGELSGKKNLNYLLPLTRGILKKLHFKIQYLRLRGFRLLHRSLIVIMIKKRENKCIAQIIIKLKRLGDRIVLVGGDCIVVVIKERISR